MGIADLRGCRRGILAVTGAAAASGIPACAHGFGERYDLPLPLSYFLAGASATVALSFVVVAAGRRQRDGRVAWRVVLDDVRIVRLGLALASRVVQAASVAMFVLVVVAGAIGAQGAVRNIAPVAVWVLWWVGFSFICAFAGNFWPVVNPWDALFVWGRALARRVGLARRGSFGVRYPRKLGVAPAVALLAAVVLGELAWAGAEMPRLLAAALVAYGLITWTGMAVFGRRAWLAHGEVFCAYFGILGRFAPIGIARVRGRRALVLRPFASALLEPAPRTPWFARFVVVVLASVTFDGLSETPLWALAAEAWEPIAGALLGPGAAPSAALASGWIAFVLLFTLLYDFLVRVAVRAAGGLAIVAFDREAFARRFVLTLVPIAIAYHLAHYLSFLLLAGQYAIPLASDPLGFGWDLFGTALYRIDIGIVDAQFVWHLSLIAIVAGHVVAVTLAHLVALEVFGTRAAALRSQYPTLVFMLLYTATSLWILAQPIVRAK